MRVRKVFLLAVVLTSTNGHSLAHGTLIGQGIASCEVWTEARKSNSGTANLSAQWVAGFLSGMNVDTPEPDYLLGADYQRLMSWIDNYCESHPRDLNAAAAFKLMEDLRGRR